MEDSRLWLYDYERCSAPAVAGEHGAQRCGVLGIDEAGRGSWVGPVVAAAAYILPEAYLDERLRGTCALVDDSKKLSREQRELLFTQITGWRAAGLLRVEAGQSGVAEIEAHNIVGATALAMLRAVAALQLPCELPAGVCVKVGGKRAQKNVLFATPASAQSELFNFTTSATDTAPAAAPGQAATYAATGTVQADRSAQTADRSGGLCDGQNGPASSAARIQPEDSALSGNSDVKRTILPPQVWVDGIPMAKRLPFGHQGIVSGDGTSLAIAIASIWAKVTRDRLLAQMATQFPLYGWEGNAGYGTPAHVEALRTYGACCHHRPKFLRKQGL